MKKFKEHIQVLGSLVAVITFMSGSGHLVWEVAKGISIGHKASAKTGELAAENRALIIELKDSCVSKREFKKGSKVWALYNTHLKNHLNGHE